MVLFSMTRRLGAVVALVALLLLPLAAAWGQGAPVGEPGAVVRSLGSLAAELDRVEADLARAQAELARSEDQAARDALQEEIRRLRERADGLGRQLEGLATGIDIGLFADTGDGGVDLRRELEELIQPFLFMLKSATEDSRQIERLRRDLSVLERRHRMAGAAVASLRRLLAAPLPEETRARLELLLRGWQEREATLKADAAAAEEQLQARLELRELPLGATQQWVTEFFRERGLSLVLGVGGFILVFALLRLAYRTAHRHLARDHSQPGFLARVAGLAYHILSFVVAVAVMLAIFDARNDWLLLGASFLILFALGWTVARLMPHVIELATLLLNLGSVREGERLIFNGVPWLVRRLDLYSRLHNPALAGGDLALPARQLLGLQSRPVVEGEVWFPTRSGDWILLDGESLAQVELQTPEVVQLRLIGGAGLTLPTAEFLRRRVVDLAQGFRVSVPFGIDYRHQAEATDLIARRMTEALRDGLAQMLPATWLRQVDVDLAHAGNSSLDFMAKVDLAGEAAGQYDQLRRAVARLLVDACNRHGWVIPFQQVMIHRAGAEDLAAGQRPATRPLRTA
jgi:VIT1/CCC1 family predicted Fe2+/Mn2+ transporter